MINVIARRPETDHGATVVDPEAPGAGPAECPKVRHLPAAQPKGVRGAITAGVRLPGNLVLVVDCVGDTPAAAERADGSHNTVLVSEAEKVTGRGIGITDNHSEVIDAARRAGVAAKRAEINHLAIAKKACVLLPADMPF